MRSAEAYADLLRLDRPIVTTREAATRWRVERSTAIRRLHAIEEAGLARLLRRGLWALDPDLDPFVVPPYLTAPLPAYVSMWSALHRHGLIEQIPGRITVASLDRPRRIETGLGVYEIHHLAPELIGGFGGSAEDGYLATPEKAVFDTVYVRAAAKSRAFFPELSLPGYCTGEEATEWTERIASPRLRAIVSRRLGEVVGR